MLNPAENAYRRPAARLEDGRLEVRASALGRCRRALWYTATSHPISNPPAPESLTVLEAGNALEPVVVRAMQRAGWTLQPVDRDAPASISVEAGPSLTVTGHPDAIGSLPPQGGTGVAVERLLFGSHETTEDGDDVVIEIKTRGPEAFKRWRTLGAERSHPDAVAQAACYTLGLFAEFRNAVIATLDTGARQWDYELLPAARVERTWRQTSQRLAALGEHYERHGPDSDALPERDFAASDWQCRRCPYLNACQPGAASEASPTVDSEPLEPVSEEQARTALRGYEQVQQQLKPLNAEKRQALSTLERWLQAKGVNKASLEGGEKSRTIGIVATHRYAVDHRRLNALLDPETRAEIVTEHRSQYLRIS